MNGIKNTHKRPRKGSTGNTKTHQRTIKVPSKPVEERVIYTVAQMAAFLQVTPKTARNIIAAGEVEAKKVGHEWRVLGQEILNYMRGFKPITKKDTI